MDEKPIMGLREFRLRTTEVDVPTRVVASKPIRSIGLWIPDGYRVEGRIVRKEPPEREKP